jgi:ABC-type histidine transport system ATPase subunit
MTTPTVGVSPEQVAKVLEVLERSEPPGRTVAQIADEMGLSTDLVLDAYAALLRKGYNVAGRIL